MKLEEVLSAWREGRMIRRAGALGVWSRREPEESGEEIVTSFTHDDMIADDWEIVSEHKQKDAWREWDRRTP